MPTKTTSHPARKKEQPLITAVYESVGSLLNIENVSSEGELADVVEHRLPTRSLRSLIKGGLQESSLYDLVIPRRTLEHREQGRTLLTTEESDKAVRVARTIALAERVFNDKLKAWAWLNDSDQFDGKSPLQKAATAAGARQVEERLYQIYYGIFG
jgi:putative toxin-antitoxin system antitoxin component (TIGR02293 family)